MIINIGGRTDIVNYYSDWLINRIHEGFCYVRNPLYPQIVYKYDLSPNKVDFLLMCSKNYYPILNYIDELNSKYRLICHYTITAYGNDIEPNVPSIDESIETLIKLSNKIGKEKVIWRFDPILLTKKYNIITQSLFTCVYLLVDSVLYAELFLQRSEYELVQCRSHCHNDEQERKVLYAGVYADYHNVDRTSQVVLLDSVDYDSPPRSGRLAQQIASAPLNTAASLYAEPHFLQRFHIF